MAALASAEDSINNNLRGSEEITQTEQGHRQLAAWSKQYKYQTCKFTVFSVCASWKTESYKWCVQKDGANNFPGSIGGHLLVGDLTPNTRLKEDGNKEQAGCGGRTDIGDGSCSYDSTYAGMRLYKC